MIPELDLELNSSGAGRYTTVEGIIETIKKQLTEANPFAFGDAAASDPNSQKLRDLIKKMDNMIGLTVILDDPAGNSWIMDADEVTHYERTFEQNEELGINDMKTENY